MEGTSESLPRRLLVGSDISGEIERSRSRFRAVLRRVDSEAAAREFVAEMRKSYPDARHHCSAFLVEVPGANRVERSSDDGEPAGTAGTPMLEVLRGSGLTDLCAVVIRWFGGTKLGAGGLFRAYGQSVSEAIRQAHEQRRIVEVVSRPVFFTEVDHTLVGGLESALRTAGLDILGIDYGRRACLRVAGDPAIAAPILAARTSGGAEWEPDGWARIERPLNSSDGAAPSGE